uniref:leucine-rich repeat domain-containing protein n=1 Tax=uncultured Ruminococcus sp. TaxID=165186 RepID=UPI0025CF4B0C
MFKRIIAGVLSTVICSSAITSGAPDQSAWAVTTGALNDATRVYDENIPKTEDDSSVRTTIKAVPDKSTIIETVALGENITADIYSNGLLRISGYGDMNNFGRSPFQNAAAVKQILFEDADAEKGLVISSIGNYAFSGMTFLHCSSYGSADKAAAGIIVLPDGIRSIGEYAFQNCTGITSFTVPDSVTSIGGQIFNGCVNLKELTLPYAATSKAVAAGEENADAYTSVADLFMYSWIDSYNDGMDFSAYAIEKITITGGEIVPNYAFSNMKTLKTIDLSGTKVTSLGGHAVNNCTSLESIKLPSTLKNIGSYAFQNCTAIKKLDLPDSIETIAENAFQNCTGIISFTVPDSVTSIGGQIFNG